MTELPQPVYGGGLQVLHLRLLFQIETGVRERVVAFRADVEEDHARLLPLRLVLEEHRAVEGEGGGRQAGR